MFIIIFTSRSLAIYSVLDQTDVFECQWIKPCLDFEYGAAYPKTGGEKILLFQGYENIEDYCLTF